MQSPEREVKKYYPIYNTAERIFYWFSTKKWVTNKRGVNYFLRGKKEISEIHGWLLISKRKTEKKAVIIAIRLFSTVLISMIKKEATPSFI